MRELRQFKTYDALRIRIRIVKKLTILIKKIKAAKYIKKLFFFPHI